VNLTRQLELSDSREGVRQNLLFGGDLDTIVQMLPRATAAFAEDCAFRLDPSSPRLENCSSFAARKPFLPFDNFDRQPVPRRAERHENRDPVRPPADSIPVAVQVGDGQFDMLAHRAILAVLHKFAEGVAQGTAEAIEFGVDDFAVDFGHGVAVRFAEIHIAKGTHTAA